MFSLIVECITVALLTSTSSELWQIVVSQAIISHLIFICNSGHQVSNSQPFIMTNAQAQINVLDVTCELIFGMTKIQIIIFLTLIILQFNIESLSQNTQHLQKYTKYTRKKLYKYIRNLLNCKFQVSTIHKYNMDGFNLHLSIQKVSLISNTQITV